VYNARNNLEVISDVESEDSSSFGEEFSQIQKAGGNVVKPKFAINRAQTTTNLEELSKYNLHPDIMKQLNISREVQTPKLDRNYQEGLEHEVKKSEFAGNQRIMSPFKKKSNLTSKRSSIQSK
jgi:hypothetical protein